MSFMRETMWQQPAELRRLFGDLEPVERVSERIAGRRVLLVGTGTSWHAAEQGAWLLRLASVEAWAVQAFDAALYGPRAEAADALIVLSHRGTKRYGRSALEQGRAAGAECIVVGGRGAPEVELETVAQERSSAFTASHLGALARLAQLAATLGAELGDLSLVPGAVAAQLDGPGPGVEPPARLLELTGAGINQWTAAEGALKVRETAYVATEGLAVEQLLHGPAVALRAEDALVCLDGGGPGAERVEEVAAAAEQAGARVHRIRERALGEALSIFPLTTAVQRIALECAERLGTDPDSFGRDLPGHEAWDAIEL